MKIIKYAYCLFFAGLISIISCKQIYTPPQISGNHTYLVVDGFINAGADSTIFSLSRSVNLNSSSTASPELGAQLTVQGTNGYTSPLLELGNGRYGANGLNLDNSQNYRLLITTNNGEKYQSAYTAVKKSPAIDSISWQLGDSGVTVFANTHDPLNNTHYYRWEYTETWEYHSHYGSFSHWDNATQTIINNTTEVPHVCYKSMPSTNIIIASSAKLKSDIIYASPITLVPLNSEKIVSEYSILVTQHAVTLDEYNYWLALQSSTQTTGSLFDQQPTEITGNITCISNPNEPVLGYVGAGTVVSSRIFIFDSQVYPWFYNNASCVELKFPAVTDSILVAINNGYVPVAPIYAGPVIVAYYFSFPQCVDCTLEGGTTTKPSFWQ